MSRLPALGLCLLLWAPAGLWAQSPAGHARPKSEKLREFGLFQPEVGIIDVPTAGVLDYGSFGIRTRFFSGGGVLNWLSFGVFQRLSIGASFHVDRFIGDDSPVDLARPELQLKFRFFDGDRLLPALAAGFDGQGYFYNRSTRRFSEKGKGLYLAASQEILTPGLMTHYGLNISDFDSDDVYGFLGLSYNIQDKASLLAEFDNLRRSDQNRLNAGVRIYATPFLSLDLGVREIGKSEFLSGQHRKSERIVQFRYVGNF
ncbi:MAG: hypothetical protein HY611_05220 [Elusimicrobia bacterium]|nr:hypothetical protein [Elusimicrobiota bacterium]